MTNKIVYDNQFNANEWFVLLSLCLGLCLILLLPRRFPLKLSIVYFMFGVTFGALSDHNIGTVPISYYDTADTSVFDLADMPSILMYGPYSYVFFYIYDWLNMSRKFIPLYVLCFACVSTALEWFATRAGVFHYTHGYWLGVSFLIYLIVHSLMIALYYCIRRLDRERISQ